LPDYPVDIADSFDTVENTNLSRSCCNRKYAFNYAHEKGPNFPAQISTKRAVFNIVNMQIFDTEFYPDLTINI